MHFSLQHDSLTLPINTDKYDKIGWLAIHMKCLHHTVTLTGTAKWCPLWPYGYSYKASCARPRGKPSFI